MPYSADIEILWPDLSEAVTPQTIPQFWPPDSLDYRSELLLPAVSYYSRLVFCPNMSERAIHSKK